MPSAQGPKVDAFYHSGEWRDARDLKIRMSHGQCEKCGKKGTEVHHIVPLTEDNVGDPNIRVGMGNLMLLCKSCHDSMRGNESHGRCKFGINGDVVSIEPRTPPGGWPK
jgi:5-methylcytosine-specific restriction endonuclease McrA